MLTQIRNLFRSSSRSRRTRRTPYRLYAAVVQDLESRQLLSAVAGSPDIDFGNGGLQEVVPTGYQRSSSPFDIVVSGDGTIFGFAEYHPDGNFSETLQFVFARDASGMPVETFGNDGFLDPEALGFEYRVESIAVQPDGRIVLGGSSGSSYGSPGMYQGDFGFTRLHADGTLDTSFGSGGIVNLDADYNDHSLSSIVVRSSGAILAVGTSQLFTGENYIALMQLTATGQLDHNFGGDLSGPGYNLSGYNARPHKVIVDPVHNRILVAAVQQTVGHDNLDITVHQFFDNGVVDLKFGGRYDGGIQVSTGDGLVEVGHFNTMEEVESITLNGPWIYVAGYRYDPITWESQDFVARISRGPGHPTIPVGVWDESWGEEGFLPVDQLTLSLLEDPNGGFFLAGDPGDFDVEFVDENSNFAMAVARYAESGGLVTTFGDSGMGKIPTTGPTTGYGSRLFRDGAGSLVFARDIYTGSESGYQLHLAKFLEFDRVDQPVITAPAAFSRNLTPTITWNQDPVVQRYDLWVDNLSTGASQVIRQQNLTTNSFTPPSALAAGSYRAWVKGFSPSATASAWSVAFDFEIQPVAPVVSTSLGITSDRTPTIDWNDVAAATSYDVWVSQRNSPTLPLLHIKNLGVSEYTLPESLDLGNYSVWVRAYNSSGLQTGWSSPAHFDVRIPAPTGLQRSFVSESGATRISWEASMPDDVYDLWVNRVDVPTPQVIRQTELTATELETTSLPDGVYNAWVRATDEHSNHSGWTGPLRFIAAAETPIVDLPAFTTDSRQPFVWGDDQDLVRYELWVSHAPSNTRVIHETQLTEQSYLPTADLMPGMHYVWIRGFDAADQPTNWSTIRQLEVRIPRPVFTGPESPTGSQPLISWTPIANAVRYDLWIDHMTGNQMQYLRDQNVALTEYQPISNLPLGTWRAWVRAIAADGTAGSWSAAYTFDVI